MCGHWPSPLTLGSLNSSLLICSLQPRAEQPHCTRCRRPKQPRDAPTDRALGGVQGDSGPCCSSGHPTLMATHVVDDRFHHVWLGKAALMQVRNYRAPDVVEGPRQQGLLVGLDPSLEYSVV